MLMPFEEGSLKELMGLYYEVVKDTYTPDTYFEFIKDRNPHVFILADSFAVCELADKTFIIWTMLAEGWGKELLEEIKDYAKSKGIEKIVFWSNQPEKFKRLTQINKTGFEQKIGLFEMEVK